MLDEGRPAVAMVFAGGLGLAAYHAGAYEAFSESKQALRWVTGSSAGAVTAAIIAGSSPHDRAANLAAFWNQPARKDASFDGRSHIAGWLGAMSTRVFGSYGHFTPRLPSPRSFQFNSLYDLSPMKARLAQLIDFDRLNSGEVRISIAATDVETGDPIIFDSADSRIEMQHILASCGFLPEFAPVEVDGRLLVDGGLSLNAPFDPVLKSSEEDDLRVYIIDLYARDGQRPISLETALERKNDLLFGNQTAIRLEYLIELRRLRKQLAGRASTRESFILLSYRPGAEEPGPEKSFDLSPSGLAQRWQAGRMDMMDALAQHSAGASEPLIVVRRSDS